MAMYMQVDGIDGDVSAKGHEKWIEVKSFAFGVKRKLNTQPGRIVDREGSRPAVTEVTITKKMDKTSPLLFSEACAGSAKPTVKIDMCTTSGSLQPYMEYTLSNVIVSGYQVHEEMTAEKQQAEKEGSGHTYPMETITLNFDKLETRFTPFDDKHKAQSPIPAAYDLRQAETV